jgi:protein SCO1/2
VKPAASGAAARLSAVVLAAVICLTSVGCGSSARTGTSDAKSPGLQGLILRPAKPAPALALRDYTGRTISLARLRHKAVLVTFVYTHCPDVCPLIVSSLAAAQRELGPAARNVQILAVTVDPRRDTPSAVRAFLAARGAVGRVQYLLGSRPQLLRVWKAWDVAVTSDGRLLTNGHSALVYGITSSGRMAVVYPSNVTPAQIVHDVPLLVAS